MGIFIKRNKLQEFRFNEDRRITASEDWELWLRLIANFGIKTDSRVSAAMIYHNDRSVLEIDENGLLLRKKLALKYAFEDRQVKNKFGKYRNEMEAYASSYIALHLVLTGKKSRGFRYVWLGIKKYPPIIFSRRFLVIIKNLLSSS